MDTIILGFLNNKPFLKHSLPFSIKVFFHREHNYKYQMVEILFKKKAFIKLNSIMFIYVVVRDKISKTARLSKLNLMFRRKSLSYTGGILNKIRTNI